MTGAFSDIRVIEIGGLETLYAGKLLADQGAEVILVEPQGGHVSRRLPPYAPDGFDDLVSVPFAYFNGNKRSVCVPLGETAGAAMLARLIAGADVVLAGGRPADLVALGISAQSVADAAPHAVLATVTPFGWTGPWADLHADDLVVQALGGLMSLGGYADGRPLRPPAGQAFVGAGILAAVGIAAALVNEPRTAQHIDVSAQETVVLALENAAQFYDLEGRVRARHGGTELQVGRGVYPCSDGYVYLMLGLHAGDRFWVKFLTWLDEEDAAGRDALAGDEWRHRDYAESAEAKAIFKRVFGGFCATRAKAELYESACRRGIPLAPVNNMADVPRDAQMVARQFFVDVSNDAWPHGPAAAPGAPYRMTGTPWAGSYSPEHLGASTGYALDGAR